jgi:phage/plasmid-like protein (TIGR03299 family)
MAHQLATINGQTAMAYLDDTPWHGLGQKLQLAGLPKEQLIDAAIDAAQLRWTAGSVPMYLDGGREIEGFKASVRFHDDGSVASVFGPVGEGYQHIQNVEACEILQVLAQEFGCVPAAAGVLNDGARCWMLMRLADATITPVPGDDVRGYFLLHWDHTGNMAVQGLGTGIRVVCANTLALATHGRKAWIKIRHTASASTRLDEASGIIRTLMIALNETGDTFASMAAKKLGPKQLLDYIAKVIPNTDPKAAKIAPVIEARRETIAMLVHNGRGAALANQLVDTSDGGASVWAAYNAVTEYWDHVRTAEAQSEAGLRRAQESAIFGGNADSKAEAFNVATGLLAA